MAKALLRKFDQSNRRSISSDKVWKKLDDYQKEAVERALELRTLAVLFDQGTGKTFVAGGLMERLLTLTGSTKFAALLIVPLSNKTTTWKKFLNAYLPTIRCFDSDQFEVFVKCSEPKVILLHIDQFARKSGAKLTARLRKHRFTCIILDEAQRIKQRSSAWSRNIAKLRYCSIRKIILTGTPMDEQPLDMWAQFRFLRPNVFGTRWKDFEEEFIEPLDNEDEDELKGVRKGSFKWLRLIRLIKIRRGKRKFDMTKLPEFIERVSPWCVRITQDDLGWEKAVFHSEPVKMSPYQRKIYDQLEHNLVARLPRATITTPLKVTRLEKMRQVCGGYVLDENKTAHLVGSTKLHRLRQLVREQVDKSPIVIFCKYTAEVDAIVEDLMPIYIVAKFSGEVSQKDRVEIQELFQAGKIDVLVAQIKTGGVGIDLFRSNIAIMYSPVYSFIDFDQAIKRLKRRGQMKQVHIFLLYMQNTIDEDAFSAIVKKRKVTEQVLQGIRERNERWQRKRKHSASKILRSPSVFKKRRPGRISETPASRGRDRRMSGAKANSTRR